MFEVYLEKLYSKLSFFAVTEN